MSTHNISFAIWKKKISLNFPNLQPRDYFLGTQERVGNSRGKRAISVWALEVLLYNDIVWLRVGLPLGALHCLLTATVLFCSFWNGADEWIFKIFLHEILRTCPYFRNDIWEKKINKTCKYIDIELCIVVCLFWASLAQ